MVEIVVDGCCFHHWSYRQCRMKATELFEKYILQLFGGLFLHNDNVELPLLDSGN